MKRLLYLAVFTALFGISFVAPESAFACSGFPEPPLLEETIQTADVIVEAMVIEADDANMNAMLQVERYLAGESVSSYLLIYHVDPALVSAYARGYDTGCLYGGEGNGYYDDPRLEVGLTGYFMLDHTEIGTYRFEANTGPSYFAPENDVDFEVLVANVRGEQPAEPITDERPRINPLIITTDSGNRYLLPIDDGAPIPYTSDTVIDDWSSSTYADIFTPMPACTVLNCRMYSADRSFFGAIFDENMIAFDSAYGGASIPPSEQGEDPILREGEAFTFSPSGEAVIIWNADQMALYMVSTQFCECIYGDLTPVLELIAEIPLALGNSDVGQMTHPWYFIRWSEDGSTLIYSDLDGLWLIDVFRGREPEQIISNSGELALPLFVSTTGRYIGYTFDLDSYDWITIDRVTDDIYANVLPSPNELYLAYIADSAENLPVIPDMGTTQCNQVPCSTRQIPRPDEFMWIEYQDLTYAMSIRCGDNRPTAESGADDPECLLHAPRFSFRWIEQSQSELFSARDASMRDLTYEPHHNYLAYISSEQMLWVNRTPYDLSDQIDGEIVDLAWLPSLFYYRD